MDKFLHIVSFNIPYPADYGGVIDVYYKIKALHDVGVRVILHCFKYGRDEAEELEAICHKVFYYKRKKDLRDLFTKYPYIVGSRRSKKLLNRLASDQFPILFEGIHTCLYLNHPLLKNKKKAVRMHNVEWEYYLELSKVEQNKFRQFYLKQESIRLKKFEERLVFAEYIFSISPKDQQYLSSRFKTSQYLPAFHENENMESHIGKGNYCLYHGNLGVAENEKAALFLISEVFDDLKIKLKIAGLNPSERIIAAIENKDNIELISNPDHKALNDLIQNAHINILPSFQATGIKLKLINALYKGRHCIANSLMTEDTGLQVFCYIANDPLYIKKGIEELMQVDFDEKIRKERKFKLTELFSNKKNILIITSQLFENE